MSVEVLTRAQAYDRLLANLDDADMRLADFMTLTENACHLSCARDWNDDRWIALDEADHYFYLLGGRAGVLEVRDTRAGWDVAA